MSIVTIGEFLKSTRNRIGLTQKQVAKQLGVTYFVIGQWEHDYAPIPPHRLVALAKALQIDPLELLAYYKEKPAYQAVFELIQAEKKLSASRNAILVGTASIPVYTVNAGWRAFTEQRGRLEVPEAFGAPGDVIACYVDGDSMEPDFSDGGYVVAHKRKDFRNGQVCIVCKCAGEEDNPDNLITMKRVYQQEKTSLLLVPINPSHDPITVSLTDPEVRIRVFPVVAKWMKVE